MKTLSIHQPHQHCALTDDGRFDGVGLSVNNISLPSLPDEPLRNTKFRYKPLAPAGHSRQNGGWPATGSPGHTFWHTTLLADCLCRYRPAPFAPAALSDGCDRMDLGLLPPRHALRSVDGLGILGAVVFSGSICHFLGSASKTQMGPGSGKTSATQTRISWRSR
jgi:hypothetical protein